MYVVAALLLASVTLSLVNRNKATVAGNSSKGIFSDILNLTGMGSAVEEDPNVLIAVGFETCTSFAFFESCKNDIGKVYDQIYHQISLKTPPPWTESSLTESSKVFKSIQINRLKKDLYGSQSSLTTIYPYEIRLPYELISKYSIPAIEEFYIHNKLDDTLIKNCKIPTSILQETKNTTNINLLNSMGYYNAGYGLWYKTSKSYSNLFTNVNFLFNGYFGDTIPGWSAVSKRPLSISKQDAYSVGTERDFSDYQKVNYHKFDNEVYLYAKTRGAISLPQINLKAHKDGKFKIVQLADLHLTSGFGKCLDPYPKLDYPVRNCLADEVTLEFVNDILDIENPDLVVLTGDQIFGPETFDSETAILKILTVLIRRKIPYAMVFGNHDSESATLSREQLMELAEKLPYSLSSAGPEEVTGVGNYEVVIEGVGSKPSIVLYMLDSHSNMPNNLPGYEPFTDDQKVFVERLASSHEDKTEAIKLAFFHIPLIEYRNIGQLDHNDYQGTFAENVISPNTNTGMFEVLKNVGVRLVSVGHDHCNDFCFNNDGVNLCYGGSSGFGGYGGYGGYIRRIRVFEIDTNTREITSWKRLYTDLETEVDRFTYL